MKKGITVHSVVRDEPMIYYSIKSVYDYVDKILIYDTGSVDNTISDIKQLIKEDVDNKIVFKEIPIEFDEHKWTTTNLREFMRKNKGKKGVGHIRQVQIDDTETEYFLVLDGDEVHTKDGIEFIKNKIIPFMNENQNIKCCFWAKFFNYR